ncbi:oxygenase MpaB family protein [Actinomycetes bacterium M1A6_2h]
MTRQSGRSVTRRIDALDPDRDADEIARLSLVTLHGNPVLTYALFTVAFMKQVAVPTMARILHRRGNGDIMTDAVTRNDDTLLFFAHLLDHGPTSAVGRAWIMRLNDIHGHFPIRNDDSLYTLATLALDPHRITSDVGRSPFGPAELDAHWHFWRTTAELQNLHGIPSSRADMMRWALDYETREYAPTPEGRAVAASLIDGFAARALPARLRRFAPQLLAAVSPPELRKVHDLPEPTAVARAFVSGTVSAYVRSTPIRLVDPGRSMVDRLGLQHLSNAAPLDVGYRGKLRAPKGSR